MVSDVAHPFAQAAAKAVPLLQLPRPATGPPRTSPQRSSIASFHPPVCRIEIRRSQLPARPLWFNLIKKASGWN
jgi:hypothetical protein